MRIASATVILFCLQIPILVHSQVTVGTLPKKEEAVAKPENYDSLKNYLYQERPLDYLQYVGLQFYLPAISNPPIGKYPLSKGNFLFTKISIIKSNPRLKTEYDSIVTNVYKPLHFYSGGDGAGGQMAGIASDSSKVSDTYFTVLNVFYGQKLTQLLISKQNKLARMRKVKSERVFFQRNLAAEMEYNNNMPSVMFVLRNEKTADTVLCSQPSNLVLVPYFVKQKSMFQNKKLVYVGRPFETTDFNKSSEVKVENGSAWICSEVTLFKQNQVYSGGFDRYSIFYILKNKDETIIQSELTGGQYSEKFITDQEYRKREQSKKLAQEELIAQQKQEEREEAARMERQKQAHAKYKLECIHRFGQGNGELISQRKVKIGMTMEMCKASWSNPFWTSRTTVENGVYEDWYYGFGYSLHFTDGLLSRIEE